MTSAQRHLFRSLKLLLLVVVLAFVAWSIADQLHRVDDWSRFRPNWLLVLLSGASLLGVSCVQMLGYRALLRAFGERPTWPQMAAIAWVPPLGKYVPGKVVALVGAVAMLRRFGVGLAVATSVVLMLDALAVLSGLIVAAPILLSPAIRGAQPALLWLAVSSVLIGLVTLHPRVFVSLLNWLLRRLRRAPIPRTPSLLEYLQPIALAFAQWLFAGLALWLMARSLTDVPLSATGHFICAAAGAMTLSYLALFAPGGIGVRELIYLAVLPPLMGHPPEGTVALIVVAMRLWQTVIELALAGLGWRMMKSKS